MFTGGQDNHCAWPFGWQDHRQGHILDNVLLLNPIAPQWVYIGFMSGPAGATIKKMAADTGAQINMDSVAQPGGY